MISHVFQLATEISIDLQFVSSEERKFPRKTIVRLLMDILSPFGINIVYNSRIEVLSIHFDNEDSLNIFFELIYMNFKCELTEKLEPFTINFVLTRIPENLSDFDLLTTINKNLQKMHIICLNDFLTGRNQIIFPNEEAFEITIIAILQKLYSVKLQV